MGRGNDAYGGYAATLIVEHYDNLYVVSQYTQEMLLDLGIPAPHVMRIMSCAADICTLLGEPAPSTAAPVVAMPEVQVIHQHPQRGLGLPAFCVQLWPSGGVNITGILAGIVHDGLQSDRVSRIFLRVIRR